MIRLFFCAILNSVEKLKVADIFLLLSIRSNSNRETLRSHSAVRSDRFGYSHQSAMCVVVCVVCVVCGGSFSLLWLTGATD